MHNWKQSNPFFVIKKALIPTECSFYPIPLFFMAAKPFNGITLEMIIFLIREGVGGFQKNCISEPKQRITVCVIFSQPIFKWSIQPTPSQCDSQTRRPRRTTN